MIGQPQFAASVAHWVMYASSTPAAMLAWVFWEPGKFQDTIACPACAPICRSVVHQDPIAGVNWL